MQFRLEKSWHELLSQEFSLPYISHLKSFVEAESLSHEIYPPEPLIFHAFRLTPVEKVSVVIIGQDPYHGEGQAHGLSFSAPPGVAIPPSLRNIYKELKDDLGIPPASHGCLESWAKQGVLLLNATLTVRKASPKSHYGQGWELFTDAVVRALSKRKDPVVFLLWGKSALEKYEKIAGETSSHHLVLTAAHPSPYSAHLFLGCKHFSKTNEALRRWGKPPIDWALPS